jgi:hypothetical protein
MLAQQRQPLRTPHSQQRDNSPIKQECSVCGNDEERRKNS